MNKDENQNNKNINNNQKSQGNPAAPSNQVNQNKAVQQHRRPLPPNPRPQSGANPQNQAMRANPNSQKPGTARNANMAGKTSAPPSPRNTFEADAGSTRTFDTNHDIDIKRNAQQANQRGRQSGQSQTGERKSNPDGTYHYTGRNIKSGRQKFADSGRGDGGLTVSANKEKNKYKDDDTDSGKNGFIMSGILKVVLYIAGIIIVSGILSYNIIMIANDVFAFVKTPVAANVTIPQDADIEKIAQVLHDSGLIKYPKIFNFYAKYRQKDKVWEFEPGTYPVSSTMNYDEFISEFRKKAGAREIIRITIPEGYTIDQIIDEFVINNGIGTRNGFEETINTVDFSEFGYRFLKPLYETELSPDRKYKLEGYMFPDTYDFYRDENELNIIMKFLDNFNAKFIEQCYKKVEILDNTYLEATGRHFTIDDVIILASMIEREAKLRDDFRPISAVFHNRLMHSASFPNLQSDATIMYSYGYHKADLTQADLQEDLPYNTYTRRGLPPSAICNPGYEAITAALWPEENSPYYYFIAEIDGSVAYSETSAQHEANRARIRIEKAAAEASQS